MNILQKYFNFFILCLVIYLVIDKVFTVEKMSNTDIKKMIKDEYKIDVDAIRNLSKLANDLTVNNKLIVPGGLEIQGPLTVSKNITTSENITVNKDINVKNSVTIDKNLNVKNDLTIDKNLNVKNDINAKNNVTIDKNLNVKKQTTLHELYGGKRSINGFRAIQINGGHIMFDVGNYGYGFHNNGYRYQRHGDSYSNNNFSGKVYVNGDLQTSKNLTVNGNANASKVNISGSNVHLLTINKTNNDQTNLIEFKYKGKRKIRLGIDGLSRPWYGDVRGWSR